MSTGTVTDVRLVSSGVRSNASIACIHFDFEVEDADGTRNMVTYVCPMGSRTVKLSGSYSRGPDADVPPDTRIRLEIVTREIDRSNRAGCARGGVEWTQLSGGGAERR